MRFIETDLKGAFILELEKLADGRGFFARSYCQKEYEKHGLNPNIAQCNISYNKTKGTLRGMHFQEAPMWEAKTVMCMKGSIYDVIIDLRPESVTYCKWKSYTLNQGDRKLLYIPEGFAHGFQTLEDHTEILYLMSEFYSPDHARGIRYDDPHFNIEWPIDNPIVSDRDRSYPDFKEEV